MTVALAQLCLQSRSVPAAVFNLDGLALAAVARALKKKDRNRKVLALEKKDRNRKVLVRGAGAVLTRFNVQRPVPDASSPHVCRAHSLCALIAARMASSVCRPCSTTCRTKQKSVDALHSRDLG